MSSRRDLSELPAGVAGAGDLGELLRGLATVHGSKPAISGPEESLSFVDLDRRADRWAAALAGAGVGVGQHVGLLAANGPEWLAIAFGVWRAGATLVPISTFVTARELRQTLTHADVDVLITVPRLRSHDYLALVDEVGPLEHLREIVVLSDEPARRFRPAAAFLSAVKPLTAPPLPESIACILYTSGTTGEPKGVMLSHRAILSTVAPTAVRTGLTAADSLVSTLPLFWVAGLVIRALPTIAAGCELILIPSFTADVLVDTLQARRPTGIHLRPPQVAEVLRHPACDATLFARVRRGGGRLAWYCPPLDFGDARFITGYGMTEMAGYVTALDWRDSAADRATGFGAVLPAVDLRIVDDVRVCGPDQVGEIRVRGPGLFSGYYKQPPRTSLDAEGFFMTGDVGSVSADGALRFTGRTKDLLRIKGINVSPLEVEAILATHPGVATVYVVGLPPDGLEQTLVALIVKGSGEVSEADLRVLAGKELSHYKRPQHYIFIDQNEVPLSGTSKPRRNILVEIATARLRSP